MLSSTALYSYPLRISLKLLFSLPNFYHAHYSSYHGALITSHRYTTKSKLAAHSKYRYYSSSRVKTRCQMPNPRYFTTITHSQKNRSVKRNYSVTDYSKKHAKLPSYFFGLNSVHKAKEGTLKDFVKRHEGHTIISKILIANNGIAAVKEIRSIRKWAYLSFGDEHIIQFVAMATPEDLKANAEYIRMADQYIEVPGGTSNNNYANVDLIVDIAETFDVDAVWAGWGHASENPHLPEKLAKSKRKIVFIGPPGSAMRSLGDKISSTIVAQHANVPCIPWSGSGVDQVLIDKETGIVSVEKNIYQKGCCSSPEDGLKKAKKIGFPVMIKASEGGGGKGIRKVENEDDFIHLYQQAVNEFPGSPMFVMKQAGKTRHLEVQLLADQYGTNITLFGRDCSVQRRHQKIIEEAPVTIASDDIFSKMEKAAIRLGKLVGYVSAGTVEFLYSVEEKKYFFLELNPRLQVEHPTTEMISGVNLPAAQLQIAMGIPMYRIEDIRKLYLSDPQSASEIDFELKCNKLSTSQNVLIPRGHCTACRITSEDPNEGFKPSSGSLHELNFKSSSNVWGYFSVGSGGAIHSFSDSQFGHIFAFGETREESRKNLVVALKELSIRSDFRTTVEYLIKLLQSDKFVDNKFSTDWLDELISHKISSKKPDPFLAVICGAATKAYIASKHNRLQYMEALKRGHIPFPNLLCEAFNIEFKHENIRYTFEVKKAAHDRYIIQINDSNCEIRVYELSDGGLLMSLDGKSHIIYWKDEVSSTRISVDSMTALLEEKSDQTLLRTPSPGKLVKFLVDDDKHVEAGQPYAEIEIMKMQMPLISAESGFIHILKQPGCIVETGDTIATLSLDDLSKIKHATKFEGRLPFYGSPVIEGTKRAHSFSSLKSKFNDILQGFENQNTVDNLLRQLFVLLRDPYLPYSEWHLQLSGLHSRIPKLLDSKIDKLVTHSLKISASFPANQIQKLLKDFLKQEDTDPSLIKILEPLLRITERYINGLKYHEHDIFVKFFEEYYRVEKLFTGTNIREEDVVLKLRDKNADDLKKVTDIVLSHSMLSSKNILILKILNHYLSLLKVSSDFTKQLSRPLKDIVELNTKHTSDVKIKARELLIRSNLPSFLERTNHVGTILSKSASNGVSNDENIPAFIPDISILEELINCNYTLYDTLIPFLKHPNKFIAIAAANVYIRRAYGAYTIDKLSVLERNNKLLYEWKFHIPNTPSSDIRQRNDTVGHLKTGLLFSVPTLGDIDSQLSEHLSYCNFETPIEAQKKGNVINIYVHSSEGMRDEDSLGCYMEKILLNNKLQLINSGIYRVTFMIDYHDGSYPRYFTFNGPTYNEDTKIRHIEPALALQLELGKMSNFNLQPIVTANRNTHIFEAVSKTSPSDKRFFTRGIVRTAEIGKDQSIEESLTNEAHKVMSDILDNLEIIDTSNSDLNHIFLTFTSIFKLSFIEIQNAFGSFLERYGRRLLRSRVSTAEIRIIIQHPEAKIPIPIRAFISNVSGYAVRTELYTEMMNFKNEWILKSVKEPGSMHSKPISTPYPVREVLQQKRFRAHSMGTTYIYDFPELFRQASLYQWKKHTPNKEIPNKFFTVKELVEDENGELIVISNEYGHNDIGMVGFVIDIKTPEYPGGRRIVVLANDITFKMGSFGPREDQFFNKVTSYCRLHGLPRIYLSANSGARIGIAEELIPLFKVSWKDNTNPSKGFDYLYLTDKDMEELKKKGKESSVITTPLTYNDKKRHILKTIVGSEEGLGVESLQGSSLIAGATSRAYKDIFTITLVTGRSVGIGAYLVRLGQRTIQIEGHPIILTGAAAINRILGREVYTSNLQLGGTQIMHKNGIAHLTASDDLSAVKDIMNWLSYIPAKRNLPVPILANNDNWDRNVDYSPPENGTYDVRWMIEGCDSSDGFKCGMFDKGSFSETLSGWAKGVVVGRARLGGIPLGVIAVETRPIENSIPADPANPNSTEIVTHEAGQVWYPNSAFKTAQAINDFNNGEQLPLIILANWRGFSGGQQDMYNEVLKYGSFIIESLVNYKQPVMIYIPPYGELRGGSWVVVDPTINSEQMEMYADVDSRAGVLEPEGMVEIKYRKEKLLDTMSRIDDQYRSLKNRSENPLLSFEAHKNASKELKLRENRLLPIYRQIAIQFSDLHDRTGRMLAKGVIRNELHWINSRRFFFWRLKRKLNEEYILRKFDKIMKNTRRVDKLKLLQKWYPSSVAFENDKEVSTWIEKNQVLIKQQLHFLKVKSFETELLESIKLDPETSLTALSEMYKKISYSNRQKIIENLK